MSGMLAGLRLTQGIGTGARSRIYLAVDLKTGQRYAVKRVTRNSAEDDRFLEQAETEYEVSTKVDHPVIRKCFDVHRVRKLLQIKELYLVMEYVPGTGLDRSMPNRLAAFLNLFLRVCEGLGALHQAGYVHTDIKPNNIMIAPGGVVKIIDLGQACLIGHRKDRIQGTPDYIAPEQVERGALTQRMDVFNLGATMYYLLTLKTYPTQVRGADARGGIAIVDKDAPVVPIEINPKIPLALSNLVMDCCREDPSKRPADMVQVQHRLRMIRDIWQRQREEFRRRRAVGQPEEMAQGGDEDQDLAEGSDAPGIIETTG